MGLFSKAKPKIKVQSTRKDSFSGWLKCTDCGELIHAKELEKNLHCCPKCDCHYRLSAAERIESLVDRGTFDEIYDAVRPLDPLRFVDSKTYPERIKGAQVKSGLSEAVRVGRAQIDGQSVALGLMDFGFLGGSMGSVVGERLTRLIELAAAERLPLIIFSASGGARMQESIFSLMQMAKTSAALAKLHECRVPYISVLTNPTSGGVTASFAALGDVIIAEPKALICFTGPRVIEQTIQQKLPKGAQQSEFLLEHGMIDCIVRRHQLRRTLSTLVSYLDTRTPQLKLAPPATKTKGVDTQGVAAHESPAGTAS